MFTSAGSVSRKKQKKTQKNTYNSTNTITWTKKNKNKNHKEGCSTLKRLRLASAMTLQSSQQIVLPSSGYFLYPCCQPLKLYCKVRVKVVKLLSDALEGKVDSNRGEKLGLRNYCGHGYTHILLLQHDCQPLRFQKSSVFTVSFCLR